MNKRPPAWSLSEWLRIIEVTEQNATRIGVAVGSGIGGLTLIEENHVKLLNSGPRKLSPFYEPALQKAEVEEVQDGDEDVAAFQDMVSSYDRNLHDPVDDAILVNRNVVVVEGNWLLLNEPVWNELHRLADFTVFVDTQPEFLQERLVNRKIRGGTAPEAALAFYLNSDAVNVDKVLNHSIPADLTLFLNQNGSFEIR